MARVIVLGEFSGLVREAFARRGHDAWSCDLLPTEIPGQHYMENFFSPSSAILNMGWDLVIAHPPCQHLAVSGARHFAAKREDGRQQEAIDFFMRIANLPYHRIAIENPISIMSTVWRKPDCIIQPWQHGHPETKATCWWLKNLPVILPTNIVEGREARVHRMPPSPDRWKERSRTLPGVAEALAITWSPLLN